MKEQIPALSINLSKLLRVGDVTQCELSEIAAIHQSTMNRWVKNGTLSNYDSILRVAEYFQIDFQWLITGKHSSLSPQNPSSGIKELMDQDIKKALR